MNRRSLRLKNLQKNKRKEKRFLPLLYLSAHLCVIQQKDYLKMIQDYFYDLSKNSSGIKVSTQIMKEIHLNLENIDLNKLAKRTLTPNTAVLCFILLV